MEHMGSTTDGPRDDSGAEQPVADPPGGAQQAGGELLEDDVALALHLLGLEEGAAQHVGEDVRERRQRGRRALGVVGDLLGVGVGVGDAAEAVDQVTKGTAQAAFLMNPATLQELREIAFNGEVMPQKSTDFYPKLLSGLAIYALD